MLTLQSIESTLLDNTLKGYPHAAAPCAVQDIGSQGWNVLRGDLPLPLALLKESALAHNLQWMADFTAATGVLLAPHGKTTMAPQLFARQLETGAWGMTLANMQQVSLCVRLGLRRIILANQLVGAADLAQAVQLVNATPDLELYFLVDSTQQLALVEAAAHAHGLARRFTVLLEIGITGGRTGCRSVDAAMQLAAAISATRYVALAGVECYEGLHVNGDSAADVRFVENLMADVQDVARRCDAAQLFGTPEIILSAGGSAVFDIVARSLPAQLSRPVKTILRSGCYVTHDSGFYERLLQQVLLRSGGAWQQRHGLQPALEVWAQVQSQPEPGLAILTLGKRDASFDMGLPQPFVQIHEGVRTALDSAWQITRMNDQHAYLNFPPDAALQVGDLIGCGISHPCTTFDKWRWLPLVDDDYEVRAAVKTFF